MKNHLQKKMKNAWLWKANPLNSLLLIFSFVAVCSLARVQAQALSGSYTINASQATGGTNFQTFSEAVTALTTNGVSAPVVFDVAAGTYYGRVQIDSISGASPVNTITFDGGAGNAATRIITNNGVTATRATVQINNSPYITLRNLTIQTTGTFGWGVHILGSGSNACKVKSCIIDITGDGTTSTSPSDYHGIVINNSATAVATGARIDSVEIDSNIINYGAYGIVHVGSAAAVGLNNKFRNNTINNSNTYGIYLNYHDNIEISGNTISLRTIVEGGSTSRGIYLQNSTSTGSNYTSITNNKILNPGNSGIYIQASSNTGAQKGLIANNAIGGRFQHTGSTGITLETSNQWNIYHNSVHKNTESGLQQSSLHIASSSSGITIYNNILAQSGTGLALPLWVANAASIDSMDYNIFYNVNPGNLIYVGSAYDKSNFSGALGFNQHSLVTKPFINNTSFLSIDRCNKGFYLNSLPVDIAGNTRNNPPDIGAYEVLSFNNIAIDSLLQPDSPVTAGVQDLVVRVKNVGTNPVTFFDISYISNNGSPVSQLWSGGIFNPCDTVSITLSNVNIANEITVYTSQPNGNGDTYTENDTVRTVVHGPLNGTYTIGHVGAHFNSFKDAITMLTNVGVSGHVVFNVRSGIYREQVVIPAIIGASDTSTVTFQSVANNADFVTVEFMGSSTTSTVRLNGASYINFKYITVAAPVGRGIQLDSSSYNSIIHCKIRGSSYGIYVPGYNVSGSRSNVFSYNTITTWSGGSNESFFIAGTAALLIDSNVITGNTMVTNNGTGLRISYTSNTFIANNSIIGTSYGIYNTWGFGQRFYHNTITSSSYGIFVRYENADTANEWKNNIITASGTTGNAANLQRNDPGLSNAWDYNLYYYKNQFSTGLGQPSTAFATWQVIGQDLHSVEMNPDFVSNTDLHLTSGCKQGIPLATVTTDIEGNIRPNPPTIGAYEYTLTDNITIDALVQPVFPVATGVQNLVVRVKNVGTNPVTSFDISYVLNNDAPVTQQWSSDTLYPCDTVSVTFNVNLTNQNGLTVYTTGPNGNSDIYKLNDTLKALLYTPLNGVYTIGKSGNDSFASFNEAVTAMIHGGVSGAVVFNIRPGTYTEQVIIPAITGASATNTITFQSVASHADSVILNYNVGGGGTTTPIVKLDGASYINFKYITVTPDPVSIINGRAFELSGTASHNDISHCEISAAQGIHATLPGGGKNIFSNNNIIIGNNSICVGINLQTGTTALTDSNVITGNIITGSRFGLNMANNSNTFVANNSISISNGVGIRSTSSSGQQFYHNSVSGSTEGIYVDYRATDVANVWRNNIITSSTNGSVVRIINIPGLSNTWDYNLYHTNGGYIIYEGAQSGFLTVWNGRSFVGYWQDTIGQDKHSIVYSPAYTSTTDLQPNPANPASWAINGRATFLDTALSAFIGTDINGNLRPVKREKGVPDFGAYEFTPTVAPPLATVTGTLAMDSTQIFIEPYFNDTVARIKWTGAVVPDKIEVRQYVGVAPPGVAAPDRFMYFYTAIKDSGVYIYYDYDIDVYYKDVWLGTTAAEQDLTLYKHNNNGWGIPQTTNPTNNIFTDTVRNILSGRELSEMSFAIEGTIRFTGTDVNNPLPVQLLSLKATALKNDVLLTWSTASEVNASHFVVERLVSGNQWSVIGKVIAKGNSSSINHYQFTDQSPITNHQSLYYRLRIVDNDGSYEYSKVVSVTRQQLTTNNQQLSVYPNPFSNHVNIEFVSTDEGIANINIVDITGRDVQLNLSKQIVKGNNILSIDTDKLKKGIYFLSIELNDERQIVKLVKQ